MNKDLINNPKGNYFTLRQMNEYFNIPLCVLRDSTWMSGSEAWCTKTGQGRTCKWMFNYDVFMKNYENIMLRRL